MAWLGMIGGPLLLIREHRRRCSTGGRPAARCLASWSSRSSSGRRSSASTARSGGSGRTLRSFADPGAAIGMQSALHLSRRHGSAARPVRRRLRRSLSRRMVREWWRYTRLWRVRPEWTDWADDNQWRSRVGAFSMLLAGFVFLYFAATIRSALGAETRMAFATTRTGRVAGAVTGMAGMTMAIVMISSATTEGADADPVVSRAVTTASWRSSAQSRFL